MESVKRAWVSPVAGVQEFVAQEFIAGCSRIQVINGRGQLVEFYIDYDKDGFRDSNEHFDSSGYGYSAVEGTYSDVNVVYESKKNGSHWVVYDTPSIVTINNGYAYNVS